MEVAWIGVLGVVLGALITAIAAWYGGKLSIDSNEKIADRSFEIEKMKMKREYELRRFNDLLKPIIFLYMESDADKEHCGVNDLDYFGNGLHETYVEKLDALMEKRQELVSLEIKRNYLGVTDLESRIEFAQELDEARRRECEIKKGNANIERLQNFSFDHHRKFIDTIKKEANEIQEKYG